MLRRLAFVNNLDRQLQIVAENPSPEQRQAGFRKVFHKDFDVHRLGWFVLGRYSRIMTPQQQQEFIGLFENYVAATYSDRLTEYITAGSVPRIIGIRLEPDGMIVSAEFSRGSGPSSAGAVRVDWRLRKYHHKYKITDIIIDGLSMAANGRSELEGVAERNGGQPRGYPRGDAARDGKRGSAGAGALRRAQWASRSARPGYSGGRFYRSVTGIASTPCSTARRCAIGA
jgi:phospholipid transport system substrate-binding protein